MKQKILVLLLGFGLINAQAVLSLHPQSSIQQRDPSVYYRFGKITVDGAKVFTSDQILKIAEIKSNTTAFAFTKVR